MRSPELRLPRAAGAIIACAVLAVTLALAGPAGARVVVPPAGCWGTCGGVLGPVGGSVQTSPGPVVSFVADDFTCLGSYREPILEGPTRVKWVRIGQEAGTARHLTIDAAGSFSFHGRVVINLQRWEGSAHDGRLRTVGTTHVLLTIEGRFTGARSVSLTLSVAHRSCRPVHLVLRNRAPAASVVARAATAPTGSAAGIRLLAAENRALAHVHTIDFTGSGGTAIDSQLGQVSSAHWYWTVPRPPSHYVAARVSGTIEVARGRISWSEVQLVPPVSSTPGIAQVPVVVVGERRGTFFAFGSPAHHTCFGRATDPYATPGETVTGTARTVLAPRTTGGATTLRFRFGWGRSRTATETDVLARGTDLPSSSAVAISADRTDPAFTIHRHYRYRPARSAPDVYVCR